MTGEVHLDDGKYVPMALASNLACRGNRKIRSPDGYGDNSLPSNMVLGYDVQISGGYLGNIGL
jgi:hypothetical protein